MLRYFLRAFFQFLRLFSHIQKKQRKTYKVKKRSQPDYLSICWKTPQKYGMEIFRS